LIVAAVFNPAPKARRWKGQTMQLALYEFELPPQILKRGFWLYAWRVSGPDAEPYCYVGMTGDVNGSAQSPYVRAGAHLGFNPHNNALRRNLEDKGIAPDRCQSLSFAAFGPVFEFVPMAAEHNQNRLYVGKLERRLWLEASQSHKMLNGQPQFGNDFDAAKWVEIRQAFSNYLGF
jgi:hypothetical protein